MESTQHALEKLFMFNFVQPIVVMDVRMEEVV
jgi:hypothetical protein